MSCIVVIAEQSDGSPRKIAGEVCSEAVRLGQQAGVEVWALTLGPGAADAASKLGDWGITRAVAVEGDSMAPYSGESWAAAVTAALKERQPQLVLFGATSLARDLLGRVAAQLEVAPSSDCVGVDWNGGSPRVRRPVYAGKALLTLDGTGGPVVASLRPNVFAAEGGKGATVEVQTLAAPAAPARTARLVERIAGEGGKLDVQEATVIVAGGRGLKDPETFTRLIEPLAEALGAAIGASRAIVDAGWRPHSEQVGQTGKTVAPKLYIAAGISGAIQHLAGMRTSGTIVAINKDADAPIFKVADYGIVGDVEEVLPALLEQAKAMLAE